MPCAGPDWGALGRIASVPRIALHYNGPDVFIGKDIAVNDIDCTVKGLLFDLDGTLLDTYDIVLASMDYTLNEVAGLGLSEAELMAGVGTPLQDQMLGFAKGDEAQAEKWLRIYRDHNVAVHDAQIKAFPDTRAALERFREAGLPLGVVTSKRHELAVHGLEMSGIAEFFPVVVGPDDWPEHKPEPGPVRRGAELLGLDPTACLYIGDSPFDMQAGNGAGCTTVAALWGMFPREVLERESPDLEFATLTDLADYLGV